jgi:hypothetical protein
MRLIKVTSINGSGAIYINIDHIGDIYEVEAKMDYGRLETPKHTVIGVTTHNNGGFKVKETIKQILKLIEDTRAI